MQGHGARSQFIAMYHVTVAQQRFYAICAVQFLAFGELGAADMARAWHRDEWFTQGDAWYFLHERLTQRVKYPIQHVGLRQCATTTISTHAQAMYTNAL